MTYLSETPFNPDDTSSYYTVEIDEEGPTVYSECCLDRIGLSTARLPHEALGRWIADQADPETDERPTTPTDGAGPYDDPNARKNVDAFLAELAKLTAQYGLSIWGCTCCGSPALQPLDREDGAGQQHEGLTFNRDAQRYTTDRGAA